MNHQKINDTVESICTLGCTTVNAIIETLEKGYDAREVEHLDQDERGELLRELKSIMSVYDQQT